MSYRYEFDDKSVGSLRLTRSNYEILQDGFRLLCDELDTWNRRALEHGAAGQPYDAEARDLTRIIEWGEERLAEAEAQEISVDGISIGSLRYAKAALLLTIRKREQDRASKAKEGWPNAALRSLDDGIERIRKIADIVKYEPSDVLWEVIPKESTQGGTQLVQWDVFISHASEDKEEFVRPLAEGLQAGGLNVWFDEFTLTVGDSLRRSIDRGLAHSRFGVVIISPNFLRKEWPQRELDGLVAREVAGIKVILPVWHRISADEVRKHSPMLADRLAASSESGLEHVISDLMRAMKRDDHTREVALPDTTPMSSGGTVAQRGVPAGFALRHDLFEAIEVTTSASVFFQPGEPLTTIQGWGRTGLKPVMPDGPKLYLRLLPTSPTEPLSSADAYDGVRGEPRVGPLNFARNQGYFDGRNRFGAVDLLLDPSDDAIISLTQIFRNREIWGIDRDMVEDQAEDAGERFGYFPSIAMERMFEGALDRYLVVAHQRLKLKPPLTFIAGATSVEGYRMAASILGQQYSGRVTTPDIRFEGIVTSYEQSSATILLPFFNLFWEECGIRRPPNFRIEERTPRQKR